MPAGVSARQNGSAGLPLRCRSPRSCCRTHKDSFFNEESSMRCFNKLQLQLYPNYKAPAVTISSVSDSWDGKYRLEEEEALQAGRTVCRELKKILADKIRSGEDLTHSMTHKSA